MLKPVEQLYARRNQKSALRVLAISTHPQRSAIGTNVVEVRKAWEAGWTRIMLDSDRVRPEAKYFRRVELVKALPQIVRDDLGYRNARAAYHLNR